MNDLISKVGGIQEAKNILTNAPDGATDYRKLSCTTRYVKVGDRYAEFWHDEKWCRFSAPFNDENNILRCDSLGELRQAIADYNTDHCSDIINHVSPSTQVYDK